MLGKEKKNIAKFMVAPYPKQKVPHVKVSAVPRRRPDLHPQDPTKSWRSLLSTAPRHACIRKCVSSQKSFLPRLSLNYTRYPPPMVCSVPNNFATTLCK